MYLQKSALIQAEPRTSPPKIRKILQKMLILLILLLVRRNLAYPCLGAPRRRGSPARAGAPPRAPPPSAPGRRRLDPEKLTSVFNKDQQGSIYSSADSGTQVERVQKDPSTLASQPPHAGDRRPRGRGRGRLRRLCAAG